ncbi:MAG: hypothetical protein K1W33_05640 [Clostridia bacterium]
MISNEELDFMIKQARKKLRAECKLSDEAKERIITNIDKKLKNCKFS